MFTALRFFIWEEFLQFSLPRTLILQNQRIGILYRVMQVMALAFVVSFCVYTETGLVRNEVRPWGVMLWPKQSRSGLTNTGGRTLPSYCIDPTAYKHQQHDGNIFWPSSCELLVGGDAFATDGNKLFFYTFVEDTTVWEEFGDACTTQVAPWCAENERTGNYRVEGNVTNGCSCTTSREFLVENPDQEQVTLIHGFEVDFSEGRGESYQRRVITHDTREDDGIMTIFEREDGLRCHIGGKELWSSTDAQHGITISLKELLDCADIYLDAPRRHRTMGIGLDLRLAYAKKPGRDLVCRIKVVPIPFHTRAPLMLDLVKLANNSIARRVRRAHGVALTTSVRGHVYSFHWTECVKGFVAAAVLMRVPHTIVSIVALYCMGIASEIYRRAKKTKLNILSLFHSAAAKFMLAEVVFRGLIGGVWHGTADTLRPLTRGELCHRLRGIFHAQVLDGTLQDHELERMSRVIFRGMDIDKDGSASCSEFVHTLTDDGNIDLHTMAKMFDDDGALDRNRLMTPREAKMGRLGKFLDNTHELILKRADTSVNREHVAELELGEEDSCSYSQNDNTNERIAALEEEGRRMQERIAALEGASRVCAAVTASDIGVHGASGSQDLPSTSVRTNVRVDVDAVDIDTLAQVAALARMLESLRSEVVLKLEQGLKNLDHMEERLGALENVVQMEQKQRRSYTPLTKCSENVRASAGTIHERASHPVSTAGTDDSCQGAVRHQGTPRPQQPKIAAQVQPALKSPSPRRLAGRSF